MVATPRLAELVDLADRRGWGLVLVGDPLQFAAVGRSGMFGHLVDTLGAVELGRVHRFNHEWERTPASGCAGETPRCRMSTRVSGLNAPKWQRLQLLTHVSSCAALGSATDVCDVDSGDEIAKAFSTTSLDGQREARAPAPHGAELTGVAWHSKSSTTFAGGRLPGGRSPYRATVLRRLGGRLPPC